jgi:hypothetical protein
MSWEFAYQVSEFKEPSRRGAARRTAGGARPAGHHVGRVNPLTG